MLRAVILVATTCLLCNSCALREPRVPAVQGALIDVIIRATFPDANPTAPAILLDSISFGRLGFVIENRGFAPAELRTQAGRDIALVDPDDVLACPPRAPCHVRENATYVTLWDAMRTGDTLQLAVTRTYNIERLYVMTESVTHRLVLTRIAGAWRLQARQRIPG